MMEATGLFLYKIIKSLPKLWSIMMNQEAELFTLNASIRIYQIINLKTVAIQAVSHQVRKNRVFIAFDVKHVRKAFLGEKSCHTSGSSFLIVRCIDSPITFIYHLLGFYY